MIGNTDINTIAYDREINLSLLDRFILKLFLLYFILTPFYLFPSGGLQIADFLSVFLLGLILFRNKFSFAVSERVRKMFALNLIFVLYILFINSIWSISLSYSMHRSSLFYIFNALISFLFIMLYGLYKNLIYKTIYWGVLISVTLQSILVFVTTGIEAGRNVAFFNNPNQLSYFALLSLCLLIVSYEKGKEQNRFFIIGIIASLFLSLISLSKGGIVAIAIVVVYYTFIKKITKIRKIKTLVYLFVTVAILISIVFYKKEQILNSSLYIGLDSRVFGNIELSNNEMQARGYGKLSTYYQYLFFGSGEGAYWRFNSRLEFHSTLGNILLSYGFIGVIMFLLIIAKSLKSNKWHEFYLILAIMIYGITHNGIRNPLFWIFLYLTACDMYKDKKCSISNNMC